MYKLYFSAGTCSLAVHVVLEELGVPYTLVDTSLAEGKNRTPEFLKINPRGQVPVLDDDGLIIREGAAILLYLLDKHQSPLMPQGGAERARALEWLMFGNATMHPAYGRLFMLKKNTSLDEDAKLILRTMTFEAINNYWAEVDAQLARTPYVAGKQMTAGDVLLAVFANWSMGFGDSIVMGSNVKRMLKDVTSRPAFQKSLAAEKVEYKAAA